MKEKLLDWLETRSFFRKIAKIYLMVMVVPALLFFFHFLRWWLFREVEVFVDSYTFSTYLSLTVLKACYVSLVVIAIFGWSSKFIVKNYIKKIQIREERCEAYRNKSRGTFIIQALSLGLLDVKS